MTSPVRTKAVLYAKNALKRVPGVYPLWSRLRDHIIRNAAPPPKPEPPPPAPRIPPPSRLEVNKTVLSAFVLKLEGIVGHQPYPLDELLLMCAAFDYHRPDLVVEIGTNVGKSARVWWEMSRFLGHPTAIHTIDLCDPAHVDYPGEELGAYIRGLPIQTHIGDGCACAEPLLRAHPQACVLLYLDGDHRYETVLRELQLVRLMKRGCGLVHDTFFQPGSTYNHGPYLAIEAVAPQLPLAQVVHLQMGKPGMSYLGLRPPNVKAAKG